MTIDNGNKPAGYMETDSEQSLIARNAALEKELAQKNRELEIEAALEAIRSRSLAMQNSGELREIIGTVFSKLHELNVTHNTIAIQLFDFKTMDSVFWPGNTLSDVAPRVYLPYDQKMMEVDTCHRDLWNSMQSGEMIFNKIYNRETKDRWFDYVFAHNDNTVIHENARAFIRNAESQVVCFIPGKHSGLFADSFDGSLFSEEEFAVYKRVAIVFEQAYTRFLDLQKAEAQAREAQIEAALERVRSRTMAMRESKEIAEIAGRIFHELKTLDLVLNRVLIWVFNDEEKYILWWSANPESGDVADSYRIDYNDEPVFLSYLNAWQNRTPLHQYTLSGELKKKWEDHLFGNTELAGLPSEVKMGMRGEGTIFTTSTISDYGLMMVGSFEPLSNENVDIIQRFGRVFQQSYTRYLDVQKAEEQAREARIEAALEKVRARSLAMHHSDELKQVAVSLFARLKELQISFDGALIFLFNKEKRGIQLWIATNHLSDPEMIDIPYDKEVEHNDIITDLWKAIETGEHIFNKSYSGNTKNNYFRWVQKNNFEKIPEHIRQIQIERESWTTCLAAEKNSVIGFDNWSGNMVSDDDFRIIVRFARVFEQAYTRFLDLQKAEAQARESQIQLALERVRAKTMAMQKSEELAESARVLYSEFRTLNIHTFLCGYCFYKEDQDKQTVWVTLPDGTLIPDFVDFPITGDEVLDKRYEDWKQKKPLHIFELQGERNKEFHQFLFSRVADQTSREIFLKMPDRVVFYCANFSTGYLFIIATELLTEEEKDIITRFARVFELTYTRFLDLQKAEAQVREARIETALERVRAVAMAMKQSEELTSVCEVMYKELQALGFTNIRNAQIAITIGTYQSWLIFEYSDYGSISKKKVDVSDGNVSPLLQEIAVEIAKSKDALFQKHITGKEFEAWRRWRTEADGLDDPRVASSDSMCFYLYAIHSGLLGISTLNEISDEQVLVLKRFRNVFELSYTRFDDLQRAEAQAREAQIELGLERVRARAMAMQKSEELSLLIATVYHELVKLEVVFNRCFIMIFDEGGGATWWMASHEAPEIQHGFYVKYHTHAPHLAYLEGWKKRLVRWEYIVDGDEKKNWDNFLFSETELANLPDFVIDSMTPFRKVYLSASFNSFGCLTTGSIDPLTNEAFDILLRFAKVFDLTYTRFNDLQKAEAQAREAQIETALERVRSRSMAMHKSEELKEVIRVVLEQFAHLNINVEHAGFYIDYKNQDDMHIWLADPNIDPFFATFPYFDTPTWNSFLEAKANGTVLHTDLLDFEEKNKFYQRLFELFTIPEEAKEFYMECKGLAVSTVLLDNVGLYIENFSAIPYTDEENNILIRFGKVFQQTYTRFLDLQKAEAQAREAQIEAALERVRSRAMAMQSSEELNALIGTLFTELTKLDLALTRSIIWEFDPSTNSARWWMANMEEPSNPINFFIKYHEHPAYLSFVKEWKNQNVKFVYDLNGEDKKSWDEILFNDTELKNLPEVVISGMRQPERVILSASFNSFGGLNVASLEPLSNEHFDLLLRFANVFDLTYTRFLDLKRAEAQAREAQVEASMERIRAATNAMHHSNHLAEVIKVVTEQLSLLGLNFDTANFAKILPNGDMDLWISTPKQSYPSKILLPYLDHPVFNVVKNDDRVFIVQQLSKNEKDIFFTHFFKTIGDSVIPEERKAYVLNSKGLTRSIFKIKDVYFTIGNYRNELFSDTDNELIARFAKAFEQTYTRFLDLQKAEAQAREAQIEASLERVRAKTMAMHKSEQLAETAKVFFDQFDALGAIPDRMSIGIFNEIARKVELWVTDQEGNEVNNEYFFSLDEPTSIAKIYAAWARKEEAIVIDLMGDEFARWMKYVKEEARLPIEESRIKGRRVQQAAFFSRGFILFTTHEPVSAETMQLLIRFARVFDLTYTRFLDLQKAEIQARQAKIEAAMEKVRSRAMAMQKPAELVEVAELLRKEMGLLGVEELETSSIYIHHADTQKTECWYAIKAVDDPEKNLVSDHMTIDLSETAVGRQMLQFYFSDEKHISVLMQDEARKEWINYCADHSKVLVGFYGDNIPDRTYHLYKFSNGYIGAASPGEISAESWDLLQRATSVFSLAYTRFNDLQQAEAQAREAKIQLALERVRARTMAMHKSEDLLEIIIVVADQLKQLDIRYSNVSFGINGPNYDMQLWMAVKDHAKAFLIRWTNVDNPGNTRLKEAQKSPGNVYSDLLTQEENNSWLQHIFSCNPGLEIFSEDVKRILLQTPGYARSMIVMNDIFLVMGNYAAVPYSEEENSILKRFANVFEQAYKRFLDLQKAESQAREAKIEAALEKIRSRTMAMMHSAELLETSALLVNQIKGLGVKTWGCAFNIFDNNEESSTEWFCNEDGYLSTYKIPREGVFRIYYDAAQRGETLHVQEFSAEECAAHYKYLSTLPGLNEEMKVYETSGIALPTVQFDNVAYFKYGYLLFVTYEPVPESHEIFRRFAKVFEQTYTRFLDLQKAEAQSREAQIEAALERVRARTMAMHESSELIQAAELLFDQVKQLGAELQGVAFAICDEHSEMVQKWTSIGVFSVSYNVEPGEKRMYEAWKNQLGLYEEVYEGERQRQYYEAFMQIPAFRKGLQKFIDSGHPIPTWQKNHAVTFKYGYLLFITTKPFNETQVFLRFGKVFEQTYTRFLDLKKAETQAIETTKRASVDRVRADIASMRTTADLERITPLIWNELTTLGVPFMRCGVFIMDEETQKAQTFLYTEGRSIASFSSGFSDNALISDAVPFWRRKEIYKTHWNEADFLQQAKALVEQGAITDSAKYLTEHRPTDLYLHFVPFLQGMLYVGAIAPLTDEHLLLVQALADAFSTAYARYEDFNKLEAAKKQVDSTLNELQATQKQLIQSEKMASLGELTAGIAHEIQNPLNFVNNFSEVSAELTEEAEVRRQEAGENSPLVTELLQDIRENLAKISHHGKRADAIVKGMLQHSRKSEGTKEPTDLNALCDEYLRLAYHGLRAKDKSFNALLKTDFDESIGKISIVPQDIGRVLLNIINNGFYAVRQKQKEKKLERLKENHEIEYEPAVSVRTRKQADNIIVTVSDNGNGIPDKVIDKIFQPFFTTKPTGQGTGLGLSLAYDIVKAHGGEIKVNSKEGEGTKFSIILTSGA